MTALPAGIAFAIIFVVGRSRCVSSGSRSRPCSVQARTLEILQCLGLAETLVSRGRRTARLRIHVDRDAEVEIRLAEVYATDTRFPYILFVSQAETEAVLIDHLRSTGVTIERGIELTTARIGPDRVTCVLRHPDGRDEHVETKYLLGCDGAHSTVRKLSGIPFEGDAYPQDFLLGDVEIDGPLLGVKDAAQYLIRPAGHIAYRCAGCDLRGVADYLARWFPPAQERR
jgi:2-polyprenyl-6-methoxyphenol hydroxylase-like FAD-dependent oxidoreductase